MSPTIKAELRKLLTVRSTYLLIAVSLLLTVVFAFWFEGYKGNTGSPASLLETGALKEIVSNGAGLGAVFTSVIAILFMAHEYRYNTIAYTLTANARRTNVLISKLTVIAIFSVIYALAAFGIALASYLAGVSLREASLPPQDFDVLVSLAKISFYYTAYSLLGVMLAVITRSVVSAVAGYLIYITTFEPLLALLLGSKAKYLPVTALDSVLGITISRDVLSSNAALGVSLAYLGVGLGVTWLLFVRRDAMK